MGSMEICANVVTALSIWLAARNNVQTWWLGIVGCALFGFVFLDNQLYADALLQVFFIATSLLGWWQWMHPSSMPGQTQRPITLIGRRTLTAMALVALAVTLAYGALLQRFTNAYMPFADAGVLALSVVAQCLLMQRKLQTWPFWLAVNTVSVPLFASRGLWLTAALYAVYWVNAWYGWHAWRREMQATLGQGVSPRTRS